MELVSAKLITKHGSGPGTHYYVEKVSSIKADLIFAINNKVRVKEFTLLNSGEFVEIKKIILTPHFQWTKPDEWASKLINQGLYLKVKATNNAGQSVEFPTTSITAMISPTHYQPVFTLANAINIPNMLWSSLRARDFPIKSTVELVASKDDLDFDIAVVYDAALD